MQLPSCTWLSSCPSSKSGTGQIGKNTKKIVNIRQKNRQKIGQKIRPKKCWKSLQLPSCTWLSSCPSLKSGTGQIGKNIY